MSPTIAECAEQARYCEWHAAKRRTKGTGNTSFGKQGIGKGSPPRKSWILGGPLQRPLRSSAVNTAGQ